MWKALGGDPIDEIADTRSVNVHSQDRLPRERSRQLDDWFGRAETDVHDNWASRSPHHRRIIARQEYPRILVSVVQRSLLPRGDATTAGLERPDTRAQDGGHVASVTYG